MLSDWSGGKIHEKLEGLKENNMEDIHIYIYIYIYILISKI